MAFSSWSDLKTKLLDALEAYISGAPITLRYEIDGRVMQYRTMEEIEKALDLCDKMINRESAGVTSNMVSYGRYRRFR